jgi:leader peptidase (prepilin peptidase)/N-methyltransferase
MFLGGFQHAMISAFVVAGLLIGSFLNVVIARVPDRQSLLRPGSACPGCGAAIAWYDNVPILSFLALRGRCRACAAPISWRYPLIEGLTAALFGAAAYRFGPTPDAVVAAALLAVLVALTAIDLERQILPDVITLPGILAGTLANLATGRVPWLESVLGIAVGGGIFAVIILASGGGMGGGDMKLGAMLGAFLGWKVVLLSIFLGVAGGAAVALALMASGARGRKDPIPFGPFLAFGGAAGLFWGERVVRWYLSGFGAS